MCTGTLVHYALTVRTPCPTLVLGNVPELDNNRLAQLCDDCTAMGDELAATQAWPCLHTASPSYVNSSRYIPDSCLIITAQHLEHLKDAQVRLQSLLKRVTL